MMERFTDRSRRVMQLAKQEAQRFNHEFIGTEHILLGLVKEGSGVAAAVLKNLDMDLRKIRLEVEKIVQSGPDMVTMGKLPQTPRAKKVLEHAITAARELHHNYVGTEHLLLGLIEEGNGIAAQVLLNLGVTLEQVKEEVLNLLGQSDTKGKTLTQLKEEQKNKDVLDVPAVGDSLTFLLKNSSYTVSADGKTTNAHMVWEIVQNTPKEEQKSELHPSIPLSLDKVENTTPWVGAEIQKMKEEFYTEQNNKASLQDTRTLERNKILSIISKMKADTESAAVKAALILLEKRITEEQKDGE